MLRNILKTALRNILKYKSHTLINISGLAVGMASCIFIFLWIQDELGYDRFHDHYNSLCRTIPRFTERSTHNNPYAIAPIMEKAFPEIRKLTRFSNRSYLLKIENQVFQETGGLADASFFEMFTYPLARGNAQSVFDSRESIVITERLADRFFGSVDPIGRSILVENETRLTVTGVLKDVPANSHLQFDFLIPVKQMRQEADTDWSYDCSLYLLLEENVDFGDFKNKISHFLMDHDRRWNEEVILDLQPLSRIHLESLNGTDPMVYVLIFMGIAFLILLIACVNFINLSTARSATRAKEIGLRKVVGASRADLFRQFLGEAMIQSLFALGLAISIVCLLLPVFNSLAIKQVTLVEICRVPFLAGITGFALITGLLAGAYPAMMLSSFQPALILKSGNRGRSSGIVLRRILVVGQFTATILLMAISMVLMQQLRFMKNKDLGMDRQNVLVVPMGNTLSERADPIKHELLQNPAILGVTSAYNIPTDIDHMNIVHWEGRSKEQAITMRDQSIDCDYFETFGMKIVDGRNFSDQFPTDLDHYILNEEAVKVTGLSSPVGKMFSAYGHDGLIIGVVRNFHNSSLHHEISPIVFMISRRHGPHRRMFIKIQPERLPETIKAVEGIFRRFAPDSPYQCMFLDEAFDLQYRSDERAGDLFQAFTAIAIFISCLGLYGMASFVAERRTKEIGIRKTLGASTEKIMALVSKEFHLVLAVSSLASWPLAYFLAKKLLNQYAYRIEPTVWVFLLAGAATWVVAMITVSTHVVRASSANPVDLLRQE